MKSTTITAKEYIDRGLTYKTQKKLDEAIEDFSKAIELEPKNAIAYNLRGLTYQAKRRFYNNQYKDNLAKIKLDEAIIDFSKAIELEPKAAILYKNRAHAFRKQSKIIEAINDLSKAIELDPTDANAYRARGDYFNFHRKTDEAIADYSKVIELDPTDSVAYHIRGNFFSRQDKVYEALADYTKSIELNPNDKMACVNYESFLKKNTRENIFKALQQFPDEQAIHLVSQALNENTLLGKKIRPHGIQSWLFIFKDTLIDDINKFYKTLTAERVVVRRAARIVSQGIREKSVSPGWRFFQYMPKELGIMISACVADKLPLTTSYEIAKKNFDKPSLTASLQK